MYDHGARGAGTVKAVKPERGSGLLPPTSLEDRRRSLARPELHCDGGDPLPQPDRPPVAPAKGGGVYNPNQPLRGRGSAAESKNVPCISRQVTDEPEAA